MHGETSISSIIRLAEESDCSVTRTDESLFTTQERSYILVAAQVDETVLHEDDRVRLDRWIEIIGTKERIRKENLTEQERRLENDIATRFEYVGWILRQYIEQWSRMNPTQAAEQQRAHPFHC
jgi:hypothetical protein